MAVTGPPVSLNQAAGEFKVAAELRAVRVAAGLPAAGGMLDLIGKSAIVKYEDVALFRFAADIDNLAWWVFYVDTPTSSGIYQNGGYVGSNNNSYNTDVVGPALKAAFPTYPYLSFWLVQISGAGRASATMTSVPNSSNWNEFRVEQNDWANGAGWGEWEIRMWASDRPKP